MNNNSNEQKEQQKKSNITKSLAIGGLIAIIILIAWLGMQIVSLMPSAISSLASLADSVHNYKPSKEVDLVVVSNKSIVNSSEPFTISWNKPKDNGTFAFYYECKDGVALDLRTSTEGVRSIACDTNYNLGDVDSVEVGIVSERNRFTDVSYTISFIPTGGEEPTGTHDSLVTVVNSNISPIANNDDDTEEEVEEPTEPIVTPPTATSTPSRPAPTYVEHYIYEIPVSNPNGYTDLSVRLLAVGTMDRNNRFTSTASIDNDLKGAIQFEVKNIGTKTSNSWKFTATLPNGNKYESGTQTALRPNERAVLTLGFDINNQTGVKAFNVAISTSGDNNPHNDKFISAVVVTD